MRRLRRIFCFFVIQFVLCNSVFFSTSISLFKEVVLPEPMAMPPVDCLVANAHEELEEREDNLEKNQSNDHNFQSVCLFMLGEGGEDLNNVHEGLGLHLNFVESLIEFKNVGQIAIEGFSFFIIPSDIRLI